MNLNELNELLDKVHSSQKLDHGIVDSSMSSIIESITDEDVLSEMNNININGLGDDINNTLNLTESVEPITNNDTTDVNSAVKYQHAKPISQEDYISKATKVQEDIQKNNEEISKTLSEALTKYKEFASSLVESINMTETEMGLYESLMSGFSAIFEGIIDVIGEKNEVEYKNLKKQIKDSMLLVEPIINYYLYTHLKPIIADDSMTKEDKFDAIKNFPSYFNVDDLDDIIEDLSQNENIDKTKEDILKRSFQKKLSKKVNEHKQAVS